VPHSIGVIVSLYDSLGQQAGVSTAAHDLRVDADVRDRAAGVLAAQRDHVVPVPAAV
jgi:hypothetical protein